MFTNTLIRPPLPSWADGEGKQGLFPDLGFDKRGWDRRPIITNARYQDHNGQRIPNVELTLKITQF
jgi:hypothetical protein